MSARRAALLLALALAACHRPAGDGPAAAPAPAPAAIADDREAPPASPPSLAGTPYADDGPAKPAAKQKPRLRYRNGKLVEDGTAPVIRVSSEFENVRHGKLDVPAYPGDMLYLGADVETEAGTPIRGAPVQVQSKNGNPVVLIADRTDKDGYVEFHVVASQPGEDVVTVSSKGVQSEFFISVTPPPREQWLGGLDLKGVTPWDLLMTAKLTIGRERVSAAFAFPLQALKGNSVRLVGFMLPLGIKEKQSHFLFSANPPSCFFHPPGGPSTAVEVFAREPIAMSYDPMVVEGRFELIEDSADGVIYRLRDARLH